MAGTGATPMADLSEHSAYAIELVSQPPIHDNVASTPAVQEAEEDDMNSNESMAEEPHSDTFESHADPASGIQTSNEPAQTPAKTQTRAWFEGVTMTTLTLLTLLLAIAFGIGAWIGQSRGNQMASVGLLYEQYGICLGNEVRILLQNVIG